MASRVRSISMNDLRHSSTSSRPWLLSYVIHCITLEKVDLDLQGTFQSLLRAQAIGHHKSHRPQKWVGMTLGIRVSPSNFARNFGAIRPGSGSPHARVEGLRHWWVNFTICLTGRLRAASLALTRTSTTDARHAVTAPRCRSYTSSVSKANFSMG